ncbi:MAG: GNAT family N-acetyltransferase [Rhodobiaceae bacterium]|nr:GNAT family N-acetyltransferase [Rhodobiaceae bacterium]
MAADLSNWIIRPRPGRNVRDGQHVHVEPLDPARHAAPMYEAHRTLDPEGRIWDYLAYGPFESLHDYTVHLERQAAEDDPLFYAIIDRASGEAVGVASFLRIDPNNGVIEVGHICYTPRLQRTPAATEAMFLMASMVFDDLGYRRYEWKCNNANAASKRAAERLGFTFEGIFRQHMVVKRQNRDTAWFSMLDGEWPERKRRFEAWLDPANFNDDGSQKLPLEKI